ncbi:bifunctional methylenetetrahydrofolate dehydrogenase/methenyltetrahydrofolate cyclohydrolase [Bifidobacterium crudilactis]|jgi:methylenetetrahydrofolate dehydrogenase (NADP+) / methenyltetrahydrofolate cyclohydrolase|uniref:Bifunctional protein FolD n=1 Tax=Bifidobacterium crudilactis TaxID=327277 RepID=A0A971D0P0_9BIFI|nr:bifunctional methylenetetrahydrofolate dehydrogenase/methenyltetrahydrofolate cyclohydrolase [Bifidobacterium crudilactis]MCI1867736.1 bifunctional methylenetetrahydrofolate dehydrogenase/methenyltetrahydrofolate cyclohydrolase [Bifidobacterium crudilactis]MDN5973296.1 bifunctional methylenetetrahydrofolate dehydrogenase/methenyltetrahydrofolate cyclohydrolase [Bifidobacterium crudilactis]MDN6000269.1 bifunctional methylenetetrahydrofolate dehydrogenase/methenyltetrahydrofolate cyclohydrolase
MALRLDGIAVAASIKADLKSRVAKLAERGVHPGLGTLLVGDDPASSRYVAGKHRDCEEVGIRSLRRNLPADADADRIKTEVLAFNEDPACTGFIVQLPLPDGVDANAIIDCIDPSKDADGMHPYNLGELVLHPKGELRTPMPCTPRGVIELLRSYDIDLAGRRVCVLGRGITIGRTVGLMLTRNDVNATVTLCHTGTADMQRHLREAEVIIAATGRAGIVTADDVAPDAVLVDVGVSRVKDPVSGKWRIVGDVDPAARAKAFAYTPNPGGVGPMTRAMLLKNVVEIAERSNT